MGAAASVNNTDWDSLDVPVSELTGEIKALSLEAENLKQAIAKDDLLQLKNALAKKFKPHTEIIKRLTARTKSQINRMKVMDETYILHDVFQLSNKYGNFLKCCHNPFYEVSTTLLKIACSGIGCDHSILVNVICSSTPAELAALNKDLNAVLGVDNLRKVAMGNAKEPLLKDFFQLALTDLTRKDSVEYTTNNNIVKDEASKLQELFDTRSDANNNAIMAILVTASRAHTVQIAEAYLAATGVDLNKAIGNYFTADSLIAKALVSWITPVPIAVAQMIFEFGQKVPTSGNAFELVYGVISRYDKPMLAAITKEYEGVAAANGVSGSDVLLSGLVSHCMTGKLAQAVTLWCSAEHTTPDMGAEEEMVQYLATKAFHDGTDSDVDVGHIANLVKDSGTAGEMKEILQREVAHLQAFHKANVKEEVSPVGDEVKEVPLTPEQEAGFSDARALIAAYFKVLFAYYDADNSGLLESDEFWKMVDALNLTEFGFTPEEIVQMKEVSDWDCAGKGIAYDEVINELAGSMYRSCVTQGINVEDVMKRRIEAHGAVMRAAADAEAAAEAKAAASDAEVTSDADAKTAETETEAKTEAAVPEADAKTAETETEAKTEAAVPEADAKTAETETEAKTEAVVSEADAKTAETEVEAKTDTAVHEADAKTAETEAEAKTDTAAPEPEVVSTGPIRKNRLHANRKMAPHIETWIHQTFNTYDVDKSGQLDIDEFLKCISAMNLGTTEDDLEKIRQDMDRDGDAIITWDEAIVPFTDIILSMTSDNRDHWIGLVDVESGYLFWYNLKDGNSTWMTDEDQLAYRANQITSPSTKGGGVSETAARAANSIGALNKTSMFDDDMHKDKLEKLRESEAKANEVLLDSLGMKQDLQKKALQERLAKRKKQAK